MTDRASGRLIPKETMKNKMIGIAKRDLKKGEVMEFPISVETGEIGKNENINFIEGTTIDDI